MSEISQEDVIEKLGHLTVLEMIALTKELEEKWGVKALPQFVEGTTLGPVEPVAVQTEFKVTLVSFAADKKMGIIKAVREILGLGLKESKDLVEAAPKIIRDDVSKEEAEALQSKLEAVGAVVEVK